MGFTSSQQQVRQAGKLLPSGPTITLTGVRSTEWAMEDPFEGSCVSNLVEKQ